MKTKKIQIIGTINNNIQTNADWTQNDPNGPGYVKGRTHYEDGDTVHQLDEKFIPDSIARKSDINDGGVNIPGGAMPGQMIVVNAVDENGKPTDWRAVDKPVYVADVNFRMGRYFLADGEYNKLLDAHVKRSVVALNQNGILHYLIHVDDERKMHFAQIPYGGETALAVSNWYLVVSPDNVVFAVGRSFMTTDYMEEVIVPRIPTKLSDLFHKNEQLALLVETDMLPAVHDGNGAILTDQNNNIILRY